MIRSLLRAVLPFVLLAGCNAEPGTTAAPPAQADAVPPETLVPLSIRTAGGERRFRVEVAATPAEQEQGLMHRPVLPADRGMIFPFATPRRATFWMKNTPSPLDLIFIRGDGSIARIAAMAVPQSLDLIDSGEPVSAVLEIAGGGAERLGIAEGDVVTGAGLPVGS